MRSLLLELFLCETEIKPLHLQFSCFYNLIQIFLKLLNTNDYIKLVIKYIYYRMFINYDILIIHAFKK